MGTLTLTQIRSELTAALGNRDDLTDARLTRFVNLAQSRIARMHDFEELESLDTSISTTFNNNDNDRFVTPPTTLKKIRSIVLLDDAQSRKLTYRSPRAMDISVAEPEYHARNWPKVYTKFQNKLELYPLPNAVYPLRFRFAAWPTTFNEDGSDDSDTSDFDAKDDILITLSTVVAYNSLGDVEKGKELWRIYVSLMNDAVGEDVERPDLERLPNIGVRKSSGVVGDYWANPFVFGVGGDW